MAAEKANIRAYLGGTGTGKTLSVRQYLRTTKPTRLLVWDPMGELAELAEAVPTVGELVRLTTAARWRYRFVPRGDLRQRARDFEVWCAIAFRARGATVYVEELSTVTSPSRAPAGWSQLVSMGRHQALTVIGSAQRPSMVDKTFLGQSTVIRTTGGFRYEADADAVAKVLRIPRDEVDELPPLHFVERDFGTGLLARGTIKVPKAP